MKEKLSARDIVAQYKEGRRDFSEIVCTSSDFTNMNLKGIVFRKANLQFCTFNGCELQNSDLVKPIWTGRASGWQILQKPNSLKQNAGMDCLTTQYSTAQMSAEPIIGGYDIGILKPGRL